MSPTVTEQTVTLPASGVTLPASAAEWKVTKQRSMRTSDGVAFVATVTHNGTVAGEIENQGTGGGTWFRQHNVEAMRAFDALVKATEDAGLNMQADTFGYNGGKPFAVDAHEFVADALTTEHDLVKRFTRASKTGIVFIGAGEDPTEAFRKMTGGTGDPQAFATLASKFPGGRWWDAISARWTDL